MRRLTRYRLAADTVQARWAAVHASNLKARLVVTEADTMIDHRQLTQAIQGMLLGLPETAMWPEIATVFDRAAEASHPDWSIPILVTASLGLPESSAYRSAAAIACLQLSIMLVDDMLDNDPRGPHHQLGVGRAANLALAFQAAAFRLVTEGEALPEHKQELSWHLAKAAMATAAGQNLDVSAIASEENYWRVVSAKSTPFYAAAYALGAAAGGADPQVVQGLELFGRTIGELIQIEDDIADAFQEPVNPDWLKVSNNVLLVYALQVDTTEGSGFAAHLEAVQQGKPGALAEAQRYLLACGAFSYGVYQLVARHRHARELLESLELSNPRPLQEMLDRYAERLNGFLQMGGAEADTIRL